MTYLRVQSHFLLVYDELSNSWILYDCEKRRLFNIDKRLKELLVFCSVPRSCEEIKKFCEFLGINSSVDDLVERGFLEQVCEKSSPIDLFDYKKLSKWDKKKLKSVVILVTYRCNLRCVHCAYYGGEKSDELSIEALKRLKNELLDLGVDYIHITGGEPLIHKNATKVIDIFSDFQFKQISTNATLVNKNIASKLSVYDRVLVSIYGTSREEYLKFTRKDLFHEFIKGVNLLVKENCNVEATIPLCYPFLNRIEDIFSFVREKLGINSIYIGPLLPEGRARNNFFKFIGNWEEYVNLLKRYQARYLPSKGETYDFTLLPCHVHAFRVIILPDGAVEACQGIILGNFLKEDSLSRIINKETIDLLREISVNNIPFCSSCGYRFACPAICPTMIKSFYNTTLLPPPSCLRIAGITSNLFKKYLSSSSIEP